MSFNWSCAELQTLISISAFFHGKTKLAASNFWRILLLIIFEAWFAYRTRAIITRGLYFFYPIFHCGLYLRAVCTAERLVITWLFFHLRLPKLNRYGCEIKRNNIPFMHWKFSVQEKKIDFFQTAFSQFFFSARFYIHTLMMVT